MKRDLVKLTTKVYDLLIIGGGIYGACVAWDAALRGLSVALVDKGDFGAATSANSLKIIHGGLRYLQHADFKRMRESFRERATLMRIAPHLVHPLPVLIPTYGHGLQGKELLSLAMAVNDLISFDRNRLHDPHKHMPRGRVIGKAECLRLFPGVPTEGLTGGVLFYDAQVYNSERLLLAFLRSADNLGADVANYAPVRGFLQEGGKIIGVEAADGLTGARFDIRARTVVNASGPWVNQVLSLIKGHRPSRRVRFAKAINLATRPLVDTYAVGIASRDGYRDIDAMINKGARFLFVTPWRGHSLVGTQYTHQDGGPDECEAAEKDVQSLLEHVNRAWPAAQLLREDVRFVHCGLLPSSDMDRQTSHPQLAKHYQIIDHRPEGVDGLTSVVGVKYTTARNVAEKVVNHVFAALGQTPPKSLSAVTPLHGGQIERFQAFSQAAVRKRPCGLGEEATYNLVYNYGSAYPEVLGYMDEPAEGCHTPPDPLALLKAEVLHAVRDEMALKLTDVTLRRTQLGSAGHPGNEILEACAGIMSAVLGWSASQTQQELREVHDSFRVRQG
jgi:glycerol-3-phosphate dehydrogenase